MIGVASKFPSCLFQSHSSIDMVSVELLSPPYPFLSCIYVPPQSTSCQMNQIIHALEFLPHQQCNLIVLGDFNAPDIEWSTLSASLTNSQAICNALFHLNMTQLISEPTHVKGNILDLLITNIDNYISDILVNSPSINLASDHFPITFNLAATYSPPKTAVRFVYDFTKADFNGLNNYLLDVDFSPCFDSPTVDDSWLQFKSVLLDAVSSFIPKIKIESLPIS